MSRVVSDVTPVFEDQQQHKAHNIIGKAETLIFKNVVWQLHPPPRASHESDVSAIFWKGLYEKTTYAPDLRSFGDFSDSKNHCSRKHLLYEERILVDRSPRRPIVCKNYVIFIY